LSLLFNCGQYQADQQGTVGTPKNLEKLPNAFVGDAEDSDVKMQLMSMGDMVLDGLVNVWYILHCVL